MLLKGGDDKSTLIDAIAVLPKKVDQDEFTGVMEAVKVASLGEISGALYEVSGIYRRNM